METNEIEGEVSDGLLLIPYSAEIDKIEWPIPAVSECIFSIALAEMFVKEDLISPTLYEHLLLRKLRLGITTMHKVMQMMQLCKIYNHKYL